MTFVTVKNKALNLINTECLGERIYLLALMMMAGRVAFETTLFWVPPVLSSLVKFAFMGLLAIKIFLLEKYSLKELAAIFSLFGLSVLVLIFAKNIYVLYWAMLLVGAKNVSVRKIFMTHLVVVGSVVLSGMMGCLFGIIENLAFADIKSMLGYRYAYGIIYTTDFSAYLFYLTLIAYYLLGKHLKLWHMFLTAAINFIHYYFTGSKLDTLTIFLTVLLFGFLKYWNNKKTADVRMGYRRPVLFRLAVLSMPFWTIFATVVAYAFGDKISIDFEKLLSTLLHRVALSYQGFLNFGIKPFGQEIIMIGSGVGKDTNGKNAAGAYNFIDCSFHNILFRYGIFMLFAVLLIYVLCCVKMKHDQYYLLAIIILAINCLVSHHMLEISYNPFAFVLLAKTGEYLADRKKYPSGMD